jgi:guanosine-3',5'-bis(diphosphate) 3'-pyrophosphohydrolase
MSYFSALKKEVNKYLGKDQVARIQKAYVLAEKAHAPQTRQSGEPYITHPVAVATILAELRLDADTIIAAILHDVIEDTPVAKNEIKEQFGSSIADLVDGVSKLTHISFANKAEAQAENFRKMILAMAKDIRVILVKLADRLHNMETLGGVSAEKRRRIARETLEIYIPIANRLGMHKLRVRLEDLCFIALYPLRAEVLQREIKKIRGNRKEIVKVIEKAILNTCKKHNFKLLDVLGREKHLYSIYRKMRARHLSLSEIMDVYAFRIIVDTVDDCYRVLGYVHNLYKPVPERFKDFIAIPKANGYQSLHTTLFGPYGIPIEIQIRTKEMDEMAQNGIAAHWLYKSEDANKANLVTEAQLRAQAWLKNLVEMQKSSASPLEFVENVKIDLFPDEVYVFTPKGDILELPRGATPVDFAYAVHSDIGNNCVACKIDRQYALLSTPLTNGQTVEIITAPNAQPNPAWLDFVITGKARSSVRHYFKRQRTSESVDLGKRMLQKSLAAKSLTLAQLVPGVEQALITSLQMECLDDLYEAIGLGHQSPSLITLRLQEMNQQQSTEKRVDNEAKTEPLAIRGTEGLIVNLAKCCHPIPGDQIVGRFIPGKGMTVHVESCQQVKPSADEQYIPLRWDSLDEKDFQVMLSTDVENKKGVLAELTSILASNGCSIEDIEMRNLNELLRRNIFLVTVKDRQHLDKVLRNLQNSKLVIKAERVWN